jgi:hypothetical protein
MLVQHILLDLVTKIRFCEEYRSWSSSLRSLLQSPLTSTLLGPNIFLSNLFSNKLSLRTSLTVRDPARRTYKTACKIGNLSQIYLFTSLKYCFQKRVLVATRCKPSDSRAVKEFAEIMNREERGNKLLLYQSARCDSPGN